MTLPIIESEVTFNGIPMRLMHFDDPVVGSGWKNVNHQWSNVLEYLKQAIRPGSRVIDAGGNLGITSIFLAKIEPSAVIYCFEPDPQIFNLLTANIERNHVANIIPVNCALGKKEGTVPLYVNHVNYGDRRIAKPFDSDPDAHLFNGLPTEVACVNPAAYLIKALGNKAPQSVDILRTDTQGADFEIIEACLPLLKHDSAIVSQFSPYHLHRHGTTIKDVERIFKKFSRVSLFSATQHSNVSEVYSIEQLSTRFEFLRNSFIGFYHMVLGNKN